NEARAIALQDDGKIVLAGVSGAPGAKTFAGARLTDTGGLDDGFGMHGTDLIDFPGGPEEANSVAVQSWEDKIVVAGTLARAAGDDFVVARLLPDGKPDAGFDADGLASVDFGGPEEARGLAVQANGKIVVVGTTTMPFANLF